MYHMKRSFLQVKAVLASLCRMNRLTAIRDTLRDEYEQRVSEIEGTNKLKVMEFQIQLKTSKQSAEELLHQIDPGAPIPQALEGGDMQGPLYQCILDIKKLLLLKGLVEDGLLLLYTRPTPLEVEEAKYRPDYYVQWQIGAPPIITSQP